jgi:hypothetical protein
VLVGAYSDVSIVLNDVPASDPTRPFLANSASAWAVSSMLRPNWFATSPDWFSAAAMSDTSP